VGVLSARPEGPRADGGFLGRRLAAPSPPPRGLESAVSSPSRVRGGAPENFDFGAFWDLKIATKQCKMMFFVN